MAAVGIPSINSGWIRPPAGESMRIDPVPTPIDARESVEAWEQLHAGGDPAPRTDAIECQTVT
ncbi:MAG: hypothetical protein QM704_19270 [Anaeromyxobacteraceae bacterium]